MNFEAITHDFENTIAAAPRPAETSVVATTRCRARQRPAQIPAAIAAINKTTDSGGHVSELRPASGADGGRREVWHGCPDTCVIPPTAP